MSKLSTLLVVLSLAVSAFSPAAEVSSSSLYAPALSSEPYCGVPVSVPLLRNAEKKLVTGAVAVANNETTLFVTYTTLSTWTLVKTDLAVASSLAGIPVTSKGNPKVDQFPYRSTHTGVSNYTYEIPLSGLGTNIYVAAHADVRRIGSTKIEGAWADGVPFVVGKRSWGMYFTYSIQPCNQPPVAVDDSATVAEDASATTIDILANDFDPDNDLFSIAAASDPVNGTVVVAGDGLSLTYQPDANTCNDGTPTDTFTYSLDPGGATATVAVTVNCVDDLPVAVNDAISVAEDSSATTVFVLVNDTDADGDPFAIASASDPANGTVVVAGDGLSLTYQPDAGTCNDGTPTDDFTYSLNPGGSTATVAVSVVCLDDSPQAINDSASVNEDSGANTINVLANDFDPDGGSISITSVTQPANGTVIITNSGADLSYAPNANFCTAIATDNFTYTLAPGGSTATVAVTVSCVDDPPTAVDDTASVLEDSGSTTINVLSNDTDIDGGLNSIVSVTQPANGVVGITNGGADLTYTPNANACNDGTPTDDFSYTLSPGGATGNVAVTVICVNDVPTFSLPASPDQSVVQDSGAKTVPGFASNISAGPANESGQTLTFNITNTNNSLFSTQPDVNESTGDLTYTSASGAIGSAVVSVSLMDNGGTADGGVDTSTIQNFTINVTPPNNTPVANAQSVTTNEDTLKTITLSGTDVESSNLTFLVVNPPSNGSLGSIGTATCSGLPSTCTADLDYTPAANFNGADSFSFKVNDGQVDSTPATVNITVDPVNDAPSFTSGGDVTVDEDSAAYSAAWATAISAGPADESGQTLSFSVTNNSNPSLFSAGPAVTSDGTLSFTPVANAFGTSTITVVLQDNGGGTDTSTPVNFAIIVNGVNDAPVNTVPATQAVNEDTDLTFSAANSNALSVADIDAGASNIQVTVSVVNGSVTPVASGATLSGSGTSSVSITGTLAQVNASLAGLKYKGNANFNVTRGSETLTLVVNDQGNTGLGGALTDTDTVNITVNAVNDAPVAAAKNFNAQANMKIIGLTGLLTGATDPDSGDSGYTATFTVGVVSATSPAGGSISALNTATGSFDFDPPPGAAGNVTFTYTVCDSGNPAPSACSAPATVTVNVAGPVIWFVNPAAGVNGDGRLSTPFNSLASAAAVDAPGHRIFVFSGTAASGITLNSDEWLIGQGVTGTTFDTLFSITPPTGTITRPGINGTRPVIQGNVAMASSDVVRGLNIQPASGTQGLSASSATALTVNEVSVTTANAEAVNLASSGGTISLNTVNANGGSRGIVLNNTTGTFTVTGAGGTCTEANTGGCSGGVIQNMTGADDSGATPIGTGVVLNNAAGVSLTRMWIHDHSNYGIRGTGVNGFILDNSVVNGTNGTNVSSPFSDGSLSFDNLSGTSAVTNSAISGGFQRNIRVDNTTGTLVLTINNNSIHNTGNVAGDDGILLEVGGGTATLNVTNNTFAAHGGDHLNVSLLGSPTVGLTFTGNFWSGGHPIGLGQGLFILAASFNSPGVLTYNISNNGTVANPLVGNNSGGAIHVNKGSGTGSFIGTISNNVIGNPAVNSSGSLNASGIDVEAHGAGGSHTTLITNNLVRQFHNDGILILAGEGNAAFNVTMTGNTVSNPDTSLASFHGVHFNIGTLSTDATAACLDVRNNTLTSAANEPNGGVDLRMRQRQVTTVRLPGYAGANNDNVAVQNFLSGSNSNAITTILASNTVATLGGGFIGGAACPQP